MAISTDPYHAIVRMPTRPHAFLFSLKRDDGVVYTPATQDPLMLTVRYHILSLNLTIDLFEGALSSVIPGYIYLTGAFPDCWGGVSWLGAGRSDMIHPAYIKGFSYFDEPQVYRLLLDVELLFTEISATWGVNVEDLAKDRFILATSGHNTTKTYFIRSWVPQRWSPLLDWDLFSVRVMEHTFPLWVTAHGATYSGTSATYTFQLHASVPHRGTIAFASCRPSGYYLAKKWILNWSYNSGTQRWVLNFSASTWLSGVKNEQGQPHPAFYSSPGGYVGHVSWNRSLTPPPTDPSQAGDVEYQDIPICLGGKGISLWAAPSFGNGTTIPYQSSGTNLTWQSAAIFPPIAGSYIHSLNVTLLGPQLEVILHPQSERLDLIQVSSDCLGLTMSGIPV